MFCPQSEEYHLAMMGYLDIKSLHSETFTETDGNTPKDGVGAASLVLS